MLYLEMSLYGKWLFDQGTSLKKANPSYQIAVVGNFLLASVGSQVSVRLYKHYHNSAFALPRLSRQPDGGNSFLRKILSQWTGGDRRT